MVVPPMTEAPLDNEIHNPVGVRSVGGDPFQGSACGATLLYDAEPLWGMNNQSPKGFSIIAKGWRALASLPWKGLVSLSEPTLEARMSSPHRQHAEPQRGSESLNRVK